MLRIGRHAGRVFFVCFFAESAQFFNELYSLVIFWHTCSNIYRVTNNICCSTLINKRICIFIQLKYEKKAIKIDSVV